VAELRVREQPPVEEQSRADPRTERHDQRDPFRVAPRATLHLGESGGIGVVEDGDGAAERLGEEVSALIPIQLGSMLVAFRTTPCRTIAGNAMPTGVADGTAKWSRIWRTAFGSPPASAVAASGCSGDRPAAFPRERRQGALDPVPPMSMPSATEPSGIVVIAGVLSVPSSSAPLPR